MQITINLPEEIAQSLTDTTGRSIARALLESIAAEGYRSQKLTEYQVGQILGIEDRVEITSFLACAGVYDDHDERELNEQLELARQAADTHSREMSGT